MSFKQTQLMEKFQHYFRTFAVGDLFSSQDFFTKACFTKTQGQNVIQSLKNQGMLVPYTDQKGYYEVAKPIVFGPGWSKHLRKPRAAKAEVVKITSKITEKEPEPTPVYEIDPTFGLFKKFSSTKVYQPFTHELKTDLDYAQANTLIFLGAILMTSEGFFKKDNIPASKLTTQYMHIVSGMHNDFNGLVETR